MATGIDGAPYDRTRVDLELWCNNARYKKFKHYQGRKGKMDKVRILGMGDEEYI